MAICRPFNNLPNWEPLNIEKEVMSYFPADKAEKVLSLIRSKERLLKGFSESISETGPKDVFDFKGKYKRDSKLGFKYSVGIVCGNRFDCTGPITKYYVFNVK